MEVLDFKASENLYLLVKYRVASYKFWPFDDSAPCNIQKMAEAGFYWNGNERENDSVCCFVCGKVLNEWEANDDPWMEHVKHAPQCAFIKLNKPELQITVEEYIDLIGSILKNKFNKQGKESRHKLEEMTAKWREEFVKSFDK